METENKEEAQLLVHYRQSSNGDQRFMREFAALSAAENAKEIPPPRILIEGVPSY